MNGESVLCSIFAVLVGSCCLGCGTDKRADSRAKAEESYRVGLQTYARREYQPAEEMLAEALVRGSLSPDAYSDALVKRAICLGHLRRYDEANELLDRAAAGTPNLSEVHAARSFIFSRQGDAHAAQRELIEAKRLNPGVTSIGK